MELGSLFHTFRTKIQKGGLVSQIGASLLEIPLFPTRSKLETQPLADAFDFEGLVVDNQCGQRRVNSGDVTVGLLMCVGLLWNGGGLFLGELLSPHTMGLSCRQGGGMAREGGCTLAFLVLVEGQLEASNTG